jgi:hypothetical protein
MSKPTMTITPPIMPPAIGPANERVVAPATVVFEEVGEADGGAMVEGVVELKYQTALSAPGRTERGHRITCRR